ncbi:unnamed protein product [Adineta ricciae]|uniref:U-box domain-containing protein n=1 Tax=Adineta ricciae TaxID=249248 RepID=A0A815MNB2_ADIRI|nr:unnamed protein product [Adineta ricciae]
METPRDFLCPISLAVMEMPVILIEDGRSYEKCQIERWLSTNNTSPMTEFREKQEKAQHCELLSRELVIKPGGLPEEFQDKKYPQLRIKICMLGDRSVGKTTIVRYLQFPTRFRKDQYSTTIGPDMIALHLDDLFQERYAVSITVVDLPGNMRYTNVWTDQYRCHGAIFVCDVSQPETLKDVIDGWYPKFKQHHSTGCQSVLLCHKTDLSEDPEDQIFKDAEQFATENDISLFHTSAVTEKNIQAMFNQLVLCILASRSLLDQLKKNGSNTTIDRQNRRGSIQLRPPVKKPKKETGCC